MTLLQLLDGVQVTKLLQIGYGVKLQTEDVRVKEIAYDSRAVEPGDVFVAIRGMEVDGHRYIEDAIHRGARAVVLEDDSAIPDSFFVHSDVVKIVVPNSRRVLAQMASNYFQHPARQLKLIGVTGTNGKTTATHLLKSILEANGEKVGLIGTIEYKIGDEVIPAVHTTPESLELNELLHSMVTKGCRSAVMEVSSHALALDRVYGLEYQLALFTNLTQDHLDFHGSMDAYFHAKKTLFDGLGESSIAVTNLDDERGLSILSSTKAKCITYGVENQADVKAQDLRAGMNGIAFTVQYQGETIALNSPLIGRFNVYNVLGAAACALAMGLPDETIQSGIGKVKSVRGRFERIDSGRGWIVIIDYAHTPDALQKALLAIHDMMIHENRGRVITIFGCGGERDPDKRPKMGKIASNLSDVVIVTSDNPRREDPDVIIGDIVKGIPHGATVEQVRDRREAIRLGLEMARPGDVVLLAGKGHETCQVVGESKIHFDDREEVESFLRSTR